jgi:hypothetical protein
MKIKVRDNLVTEVDKLHLDLENYSYVYSLLVLIGFGYLYYYGNQELYFVTVKVISICFVFRWFINLLVTETDSSGKEIFVINGNVIIFTVLTLILCRYNSQDSGKALLSNLRLNPLAIDSFLAIISLVLATAGFGSSSNNLITVICTYVIFNRFL